MSDETAKDVSPLRLKRPGASVPGGAASQSPVPVPVMPAPPSEGTLPADSSEAESPAHAPASLRRRPTLSPETQPENPPAPEPVVEAPPPAAPPEPPAPIKLRVGIKPPAPPPPPPDPAASLPEDLFPPMTGVPLLPLPGMPALPSIPAMPGIPPAGTPLNLVQRPTGSTLIGTELMSGSSAPNGFPPGMGGLPPIPGGPPPLPPTGELPPMTMPEFVVPLEGAKPPEKPDAAKFKRKATLRDYFIYAGAFVLLLALGGFAYFYFIKPEETKAAFTGAKEKFDNAVKLPPGVLGDPKGSIDGAKDAMTNRRDSKLAPIDAILNGEDAEPGAANAKAEADAAAAKAAAAAKSEKSSAYSGSSNTGVVVAPATATAPAPNPRFVRYAEALVVSGVFQGEPARALVDGRIIRSGDVIEPMLAVTFVGVDAPAKQLILEDKTGAQVRVKY